MRPDILRCPITPYPGSLHDCWWEGLFSPAITRSHNNHDTVEDGDFSGQIRSQGYQSHGSHWWNGDSPGIWGQKLSVGTTAFIASMASDSKGLCDQRNDNGNDDVTLGEVSSARRTDTRFQSSR